MPFLRQVTRGRNVPDERLSIVASQYELFGGRSPINDQNRALVEALRIELSVTDLDLPVYWGNRNWHPFVAETVRSLRAGELDTECVYAKRIRKGALDRYTATTPPHVQAARKAGGRAGPVVRYVVARTGPEPVLPGRPLPEGIDYSHYVERVLRPVAEAILAPLGQSFDEASGQPRQLSLL